MKKTFFIISIICLVFTNYSRSQKFLPPEGKTLLILGQDMGAIGGFEAPNNNGYIDNIGTIPAGFTVYTSIPDFAGVTSKTNYGAGDVCANCITENKNFDNTVLVIGLYMVNQLGSTADGDYDQKIKEFASWIRGTNRPIFIRIGYEFNSEWAGYNASDYKKAFKRFVDVFREENVDNMATVWQSDGYGSETELMQWYPGDDYVDWLAYSQFEGKGASILKIARDKGKPVMIAESTPRCDIKTEDGQALWDYWYKPFFEYIHENSDVIKAVAYINVDWESQAMWQGQNWGDSRVQENAIILANWLNETSSDFWLQQSDNLYKLLGIGDTGLIPNHPDNDIFRVYPNPVENKLMIWNTAFLNQDVNISIYSASGYKLLEQHTPIINGQIDKPISLDRFSKGIYLLSLSDGVQYFNYKIVKN